MRALYLLAVALVLMLGAPGCDDATSQKLKKLRRAAELHRLDMHYLAFCEAEQKPPADAGELETFARRKSGRYAAEDAEAFKALNAGKVVLLWGLDPGKQDEPGRRILGYSTEIEDAVGTRLVLATDGSVIPMGADDFVATLRSQKKGADQP